MSFVDEMKRLDVNNIGTWPMLFKGIAIGMICLVVLGIGIYFDTMGQVTVLRQAQSKLQLSWSANGGTRLSEIRIAQARIRIGKCR